ncbi:MAG: phage tail protein [Pseudomonas sp.]|nr:phage tail protein [Pseudomonas sp.]
MADKILHKRSGTPSAVPSAASLELGELALNTADGRAFMKKNDGAVVEIGSTASGYFRAEPITATATGQTSFTVPGGYTPGAIFVSLNGATLPPADFTATNGTTVVLASGSGIVAGSILLVHVLSAFEVADALPLLGTAADSNKFGGNPIPPEDGKFYAFKDGQLVEFVAGSGGGDHVLSIKWEASRNNIGDGGVAADGQTLSRATYPDAWSAINAGKVPVVDDAEWLSDPTKRGCFSRGDGSTTFRLPDYNGKFAGSLGAVFLRGDGELSVGENGRIQLDEFRAHNHYEAVRINPDIDGAGGYDALGKTVGVPSTQVYGRLTFPMSATHGNTSTTGGSETRPINVTGCWVIKLFGAVVNVGSADAAQLASDYANLAAALSTLDSQIDFTIIYPNGGSAGSPANVAIKTRYVEANPFPGSRVICQPEILVGGEWCGIEFSGYTATASSGVGASQHNDGGIVIETGITSILIAAKVSFFTGVSRSLITAATPCRVKVWKVKGAIA